MKTTPRKSFSPVAPEHLDRINGGGIQVGDQPSPPPHMPSRSDWEGPQPTQLPEDCMVRWGVFGSDLPLTPEDGHLQEGCMDFSLEGGPAVADAPDPHAGEDHMADRELPEQEEAAASDP